MSTNEERIWNYLIGKGLSKAGAAGLMGNLFAESGLSPKNLQNTYEKKLGFTDDSYTAAVDSGSYQNFVRDSAGYGLAQWTFWSRKQNMLDFARAAGKSIGDLEMQLDFLFQELSGSYKQVLSTLKTATTVRAASDSVLLNFERPADQSEAVKVKRAGYGQTYFDRYAAAAKPGNGGNLMGNSPLVNYTKISPHRNSPRNNAIKKITIHHMAGNLSVETCGNVFQSKKASSNYGIGTDGRVGMYVEEKDRSWASSSPENDNQAVTIEVANDQIGGQWHVSDTALANLIDLCVDICKRNGIAKLNFTGNKNGNLTMHKYFAATACPGPYLESKFPYIAAEVNKRLGVSSGSTTQPSTPSTPAAGLSVGTVVNFAGGKHYTSANAASGSAAKAGPAKITAVSANTKHPYHIIHTDGTSNVYGWVDASAVSAAGGSAAVNYTVRVKITDLNIRSGPGTNNAKKGVIKPGVYTIVQEATGAGASKWGKLKSGAGWISLDHCEKM